MNSKSITKIRSSYIPLISKIFFIQIFFGVLFYLSIQLEQGILVLTITILNILSLIYFYTLWNFRYYIISKNTISIFEGLIFRKNKKCDIKSISEIIVRQSFIEKIFQYGDIEVVNPLLKQNFILKNIPTPQKYSKKLEKLHLSKITDNKIIPV